MIRLPLLALAAALCAAPALAQDYPFSGLFGTTELGGQSGPTDLATCALSFIEQRADGTFTGYHVDKAQFEADGTLAYRIINTGTCSYDAATKIEACTVEAGFDAATPPQTFYDVIAAQTENTIDIDLFDNEFTARDAVSKGQRSAVRLQYFRCPVNEATVRAAITAEPSALTREDLDALRFPFPAFLASAEVQAIAAAVAP